MGPDSPEPQRTSQEAENWGNGCRESLWISKHTCPSWIRSRTVSLSAVLEAGYPEAGTEPGIVQQSWEGTHPGVTAARVGKRARSQGPVAKGRQRGARSVVVWEAWGMKND